MKRRLKRVLNDIIAELGRQKDELNNPNYIGDDYTARMDEIEAKEDLIEEICFRMKIKERAMGDALVSLPLLKIVNKKGA